MAQVEFEPPLAEQNNLLHEKIDAPRTKPPRLVDYFYFYNVKNMCLNSTIGKSTRFIKYFYTAHGNLF